MVPVAVAVAVVIGASSWGRRWSGIVVLSGYHAPTACMDSFGPWVPGSCWLRGSAVCGTVRLRSPGEPIAEWGRSPWEVAHGSIHAFAVHPVAVVGDGRILPFLHGPLVRLWHYGGVQGF